jgi:hypothetical protein
VRRSRRVASRPSSIARIRIVPIRKPDRTKKISTPVEPSNPGTSGHRVSFGMRKRKWPYTTDSAANARSRSSPKSRVPRSVVERRAYTAVMETAGPAKMA